MVSYASLDEAYDNSHMSEAIRRQQQQSDAGRAFVTGGSTAAAASPLGANTKRKTVNSPFPSDMIRRKKQIGGAHRGRERPHPPPFPAAANIGGEDAYASFGSSMKPQSCESFYRGCNLDDIEDVMDMYTGETNVGLEKETRKKNPEHLRRLQRTAQDMMPRYDVQPIDECTDGVSGPPETFDTSALYDGMSTVDMPYKPYDNPDIAHNSAVYNDIRYKNDDAATTTGVPRRSTAGFGKEDAVEDADSIEAASIAESEPASERTDNEDVDDYANKRTRKTSKMSKKSAAPVPSPRHNKNAPLFPTTYAMELALYIASGVFLIFVMEQFVQIGIAIGKSSAASF